jgi:AcrR family transcriptional regulator
MERPFPIALIRHIDYMVSMETGKPGRMAQFNSEGPLQARRGQPVNTRARLTHAARALFSERNVDSITVSNVTEEAGVTKGTFYVHFQNLDELWASVAKELAHEIDEFSQPQRVATDDPVQRIAIGCGAFLDQALLSPAWGALVVRAVWAFPAVASVARNHACEDLQLAFEQGRLAPIPTELGLSIVLGIVLEAMRSASERRLSSSDVPRAVTAALRALGVAPREAEQVVRRLGKSTGSRFSLAFSLPSGSRSYREA